MKVCAALQVEEPCGGFHDSVSSLGPVAFTCKSRTRPGAGWKCRQWSVDNGQWSGVLKKSVVIGMEYTQYTCSKILESKRIWTGLQSDHQPRSQAMHLLLRGLGKRLTCTVYFAVKNL